MLITEVLLDVLLEANMKQLCTSGEHVRVIYTPYPHFYIVKLGFTGVHTFFLILALKHRSWVLVITASVLIALFHLKIIVFTAVKYCSI